MSAINGMRERDAKAHQYVNLLPAHKDVRELLRRLDVAREALEQYTSAVTGTSPSVAEHALREITK